MCVRSMVRHACGLDHSLMHVRSKSYSDAFAYDFMSGGKAIGQYHPNLKIQIVPLRLSSLCKMVKCLIISGECVDIHCMPIPYWFEECLFVV